MEENGRLVSFIFRGTEVVTEETKEDRIRYIRTNELLASDAESARTYYHYASDEIGNITHVVEDNHVLNHYEYDVWGNLTVCEETIENRFKYNGQQFDPISQQYYLRARYYNPVIGRFTQEDTYRGDGLNLYAYCRNNPVFYIDPSGHMCEAGVDRVTGEINTRTATKEDVKNLSSHIREKLRNGGTLTDQECRVANQLGIDVGRKTSYGKSSANYKNTADFMTNIECRNGKYYTDKVTIDEIGQIEARGEDFSALNKRIMSSRASTEGGTSIVYKYSDKLGTKYLIHEVTDANGYIIHRDFDAVRISSGQLVNKGH